MTMTAIFFLLLLAMSSLFIYHLAGWLAGRFFRLRRNVFYTVCISSAAVFFAAACTGGVFALNALRGAEYARGLADGSDAASVQEDAASEVQQEAAGQAWQDGYGEGYAAGFAAGAGMREEGKLPTPDGQDAAGQSDAEQDAQDAALPDPKEPDDAAAPDGGAADTPAGQPSGAEGPDGTENGADSTGEESGTGEGTDPGAIPAGTTVYYTSGGSVLHRDRNCSYLKKAKEVLACDAAEAPDLPPCSRCG